MGVEGSTTPLSAQGESFSFQQAPLPRTEGQVGVWAVLRGWQRKEVGTFESSGAPPDTPSPRQ